MGYISNGYGNTEWYENRKSEEEEEKENYFKEEEETKKERHKFPKDSPLLQTDIEEKTIIYFWKTGVC